MPTIWGYPSLSHDYPYYWPVHIGPKVKTGQNQSDKFKEFAKTLNCWILNKYLHMTRLNLLDKICRYEMDLASIIEDTELTLFCPQIDGQTDGRTDGQG